MKKATLVKFMTSLAEAVTAVTADLTETLLERAEVMETKSNLENLKDEYFGRFDNLPTSYRVRVFDSETEEYFTSTITNAMVIKKKGNNRVYVATISYNNEGEKQYILRSIFTPLTKTISYKDVEVLYKGSVENCWLKWFELERENLR